MSSASGSGKYDVKPANSGAYAIGAAVLQARRGFGCEEWLMDKSSLSCLFHVKIGTEDFSCSRPNIGLSLVNIRQCSFKSLNAHGFGQMGQKTGVFAVLEVSIHAVAGEGDAFGTG